MDKQAADNLIINRPRGPANFDLQSEFAPAGDQPTAIEELIDGIKQGERDQVLLGVTGSGKTFTAAHVIQAVPDVLNSAYVLEDLFIKQRTYLKKGGGRQKSGE